MTGSDKFDAALRHQLDRAASHALTWAAAVVKENANQLPSAGQLHTLAELARSGAGARIAPQLPKKVRERLKELMEQWGKGLPSGVKEQEHISRRQAAALRRLAMVDGYIALQLARAAKKKDPALVWDAVQLRLEFLKQGQLDRHRDTKQPAEINQARTGSDAATIVEAAVRAETPNAAARIQPPDPRLLKTLVDVVSLNLYALAAQAAPGREAQGECNDHSLSL